MSCTQNIEINTRTYLEDIYLNSDYEKHLLEKIRKELTNTRTDEYGYISKVNKIVKIIDTRISSANSNVVFTLIVSVATIKPLINTIVQGQIKKISDDGIFVEVANTYYVLITKKLLEDYTLVYNNDYENIVSHYLDTNGNKLSVGCVVDVYLTEIKYNIHRGYNCMGKISLKNTIQ